MTPERLDACTRHRRTTWGLLPEVQLRQLSTNSICSVTVDAELDWRVHSYASAG